MRSPSLARRAGSSFVLPQQTPARRPAGAVEELDAQGRTCQHHVPLIVVEACVVGAHRQPGKAGLDVVILPAADRANLVAPEWLGENQKATRNAGKERHPVLEWCCELTIELCGHLMLRSRVDHCMAAQHNMQELGASDKTTPSVGATSGLTIGPRGNVMLREFAA